MSRNNRWHSSVVVVFFGFIFEICSTLITFNVIFIPTLMSELLFLIKKREIDITNRCVDTDLQIELEMYV